MRRIVLFVTFLIAISPGAAQKAKSLPPFDMECRKVHSWGYPVHPEHPNNDGIGIDGDNLGVVRYRFFTVGDVLKIVEFPSDPRRRKEYAKKVEELDSEFRGRSIVGWRENSSLGTQTYVLNVESKIFSVTEIMKPINWLALATFEVHTCK